MSQTTEETENNVDPFLIDADGLHDLASPKIVQRGITYFKEHRVTELEWDEDGIRANVEGSVPKTPYVTEIFCDEKGGLVCDCNCPFDWEPFCKHGIATLMAYAARQPITTAQVETAADEAIEARILRGKTEVVVKHASGAPAFGTWNAHSVAPTGGIARDYRVQIRSVTERINRCSCPDFATNQLGTCKHIEAVLHKLSKKRGKPRKTAHTVGVPVVYLDWSSSDGPRIRVRRPKDESRELEQLLDRHFDEEGFIRGALPGALTRFESEALGHGVDMGDDAVEYARQLGERSAQRERAARVAEEIRRFGSQIPGVKARLYPYQVEGVAFLAGTGRVLLADDMGLGKTLQSIAAAAWMMKNEGVERVLVICPASLKHQWAREVRKFTDLEVVVMEGGVRARKALYRHRGAFTIMNYELVLRDHELIMSELAPDLLILDEAQRIKNWRTKTATAVKTIKSRFAFVLTGTPLENRLEDLYSVMQVVDPRILGPLWRYMLEFHVLGAHEEVLGYRNLSVLRRRLEPVMLRRSRAIVADQLPTRIDQRLDVPLSPAQREHHDQALNTARRIVQTAKNQHRPMTPDETNRFMAALQTARMACDAAGLVDGETEGSPKLAELEKLLDEICVEGGEKVVIFSQWERMTRMAKAVAERLELGVVRLHGKVPTTKRGALIDKFENDPGVQIFLSTDAGGVGLNLQAASVVINLDLPFNPAVLAQRIARAHRLGQKKTVRAIELVAKDSYEETISAMLGSKRQLFTNVIEEGKEEVVGLSKRAVQAAMESLEEEQPPLTEEQLEAGGPGGPNPDVLPDVGEDPAELVDKKDVRPGAHPTPVVIADRDVSHIVAELQSALGGKLERVLVAQRGLLAVVDSLSSADQELAEALSKELPTAIVDRLTYSALSRLGVGGQTEGDETVWSRNDSAEKAQKHPLELQAQRKLTAAEALVERALHCEAADLLAQSMLASIARRAERSTVPTMEEAAVWLYGDVIPKGLVTADAAAATIRAEAFSRAPEVPQAMIDELLQQARQLVYGVASDG